jgi:regulator of cell morphogenesis and NO signaling
MSTSTSTPPSPITPETSLAALATRFAGASRVFQRHQLDFCCRGAVSLADACRERRLATDDVIAELQAAVSPTQSRDWTEAPTAALLAHLVDHFHQDHRQELPRLLAMAEKVERVHAGRDGCPVGLAAALHEVQQELEQHMQKEEQVLFPLLLAEPQALVSGPVLCLTHEHEGHGENLARLRRLGHDFVPPPHACGTWQALYLGLAEFERAVMEHIHLENHVLFPRCRT